MQQNQILTLGIDGALAETVRAFAQQRRLWLRETSQHTACQNLVITTRPNVLLLVLGRDLERELALLEHAHACVPSMAIVVIGEADNPVLAGLAWDLGATFALFPPTPADAITDILAQILADQAS